MSPTPKVISRTQSQSAEDLLAEVAAAQAEILLWKQKASDERATRDYLLDQLQNAVQETTALREEKEALSYAAHHDQLTGMLNRHSGGNKLLDTFIGVLKKNAASVSLKKAGKGGREIDQTKAKGYFALLLVDIDKFKPINDTYGHGVGDEVLVNVSKVIDDSFKRQTDVKLVRSGIDLVRWGGEEFTLGIACANKEEALKIAEQIRADVEKRCAIRSEKDDDHKVTISVGIHIQRPDNSHQQAVTSAVRALLKQMNKMATREGLSITDKFSRTVRRRMATELIKTKFLKEWHDKADKCLYRAKEGGRNQVHYWEEGVCDEPVYSPKNPLPAPVVQSAKPKPRRRHGWLVATR